jgi:hypothetical protein
MRWKLTAAPAKNLRPTCRRLDQPVKVSAHAEPQAAADGAAFRFGVPGTLALGSLMYSANVASSQVRLEFLLTGSSYSPPRIPSAVR